MLLCSWDFQLIMILPIKKTLLGRREKRLNFGLKDDLHCSYFQMDPLLFVLLILTNHH